MNDAEKLVAWVREAADELEKAHAYLDSRGVPRSVPGSDAECTLAARIGLLVRRVEDLEAILLSQLDGQFADQGDGTVKFVSKQK